MELLDQQQHHHHAAHMFMADSEGGRPLGGGGPLGSEGGNPMAGAEGGVGGMGMGPMHMHMTFYWGPDVTLLFPGWTSHTWPQYSLALLLCFALALGLEWLSSFRARLAAHTRAAAAARGRGSGRSSRASGAGAGADSTSVPMLDPAPAPLRVPTLDRVVLSLVFCGSAALGYLVMLLVMGFNVGVFLAVAAGHGVGVYLFGMARILGEDSLALEAGCHS